MYHQSIVYILGQCCTTASTPRLETSDAFSKCSWPIRNTYFKAFVRLKFGKNTIKLKTSDCSLDLTLYRIAPGNYSNVKHVRVLYVKCHDEPDLNDHDKLNMRRVSLNVKLLQTFIGEQIYKKYHHRKTVLFRHDLDGNPSDQLACEPYIANLKLNEALYMKPNEIFLHLARELQNSASFNENCKYLAVLSFTRYKQNASQDEINSNANRLGYCAIGAKWLAVYGTPCLFSWSCGLENLQACFDDSTKLTSANYSTDSAFKNTNSACYSTTLGSLLHEFSHILDIGHNTTGIMARGFDDLCRFFTISFTQCNCYSDLVKSTALYYRYFENFLI